MTQETAGAATRAGKVGSTNAAKDHARRIDALYRSHADVLRRCFRRRGHNTETCEDLVQEVFMRLVSVEPMLLVERPIAMLFRVARFVSADLYRKRYSRRKGGLEIEPAASNYISVDEGPTPEQMLIWRDAIAEIFAYAGTLPKRRAEALVLHRIHNLTHIEIAARQGVTVKTVEKQIAIGARTFDERLAQEAAGALAR